MKTKSLITTAGIIAILGFSANLAVAQYVPQGAKHQIATQGQGSQGSSMPRTYWNITWGAIAYDKNLGVIGASTGKGGKWSTNSAAKKDCKARGGKKCKIIQTYNSLNGCVGMAAGNSGGWATDFGNTPEEAGQASKNYCESNGKSQCKVVYTGCSPEVRVG
ncbi:protein of unknown function [Acinetobacter marinus]|uniref:DUF4189 domain-containing protein n=1 Tax=Acinetobacter marinus TaxID=281375 RepID=A0A1G6II61_9GAMM|nr:DUF4189 domain-containing protein [Acinetobacter marinus]SDC05416.1 protein of unknown function [Acinetobacter marinus]